MRLALELNHTGGLQMDIQMGSQTGIDTVCVAPIQWPWLKGTGCTPFPGFAVRAGDRNGRKIQLVENTRGENIHIVHNT